MSKKTPTRSIDYAKLLGQVKERIQRAQDRNRVVAEYALRGMNKPIGVSEYELTRSLPRELESSLPTIEAIEAELADSQPETIAPKRLTARNAKKKGGKK